MIFQIIFIFLLFTESWSLKCYQKLNCEKNQGSCNQIFDFLNGENCGSDQSCIVYFLI